MKYSNPHTHTVFCDGKNTAMELAVAAEKLGFVSLGISGHSPQEIAGGFGIKDEAAYRASIAEAAKACTTTRIHTAVEQDFYGWCEREKYDYILGSVHYFVRDELCYAVDGSREHLQEGIDRLFGGDAIAAACAYFRTVAEMAQKLRPEIAAHYDLITKTNADGTLLDETDPRYLSAALEGLEAVYDAGCLLEVNTGAIARGYQTRPYPTLTLLRRWHELGGRVIFGSDCHDAAKLLCAFEDACKLMKAAGFKTAVRLGGFGEDLFVEEAI